MAKSFARSFVGLLTAAVLGMLMPLSVSAAEPNGMPGPELIGATRTGTDTAIYPDASRVIEVRAADPDGVMSVSLLIRWDDDTDDTGMTRAHTRLATYDEADRVWRTEAFGDLGANQQSMRWSVTEILLTDRLHNTTLISDRAVLDPLGFTFKNPSYDAEGPVLESITVDPEIARPGQDVRITMRLKDASEIREAWYGLTDLTDMPGSGHAPGEIRRDRIDEGNGITAFTSTFRTDDRATVYGTYAVENVQARDNHWNYSQTPTTAAVVVADPKHPVGPITVGGTMIVGNTVTAGAHWPGATMDYRWTFGYSRDSVGSGPTYKLTDVVDASGWGVEATGTWPDGTVRTRHIALGAVGPGTLGIGPVSVSGTPSVGSTLTAVHRKLGPDRYTCPSAVEHHYAWLRDGKPIPGSYKRTYVPVPEDAGHLISAYVSTTAYSHVSEQATSKPVRIMGMLEVGGPTISGAAGIGSVFTAAPGRWTPGTGFTYQWLRNGTPIAKATSRTYVSTKSDLNQILQVRVTGSKANYTPETRVSHAVRPVTGKLAFGSTPVIAGTARVGSKLAPEFAFDWQPKPTLTYQWLRNGKAIKGATSRTYTPVVADLAQKVSVRVTAAKSGYTTVVRTSSAKKIAKGVLKEGTLRYVGDKKVGTTMKAQPVGWGAGNSYSYQWKRNGNKIKGATKSAYKLQRADRGQAVSVTMTVKRSGFTTIVIGDGTFAAR